MKYLCCSGYHRYENCVLTCLSLPPDYELPEGRDHGLFILVSPEHLLRVWEIEGGCQYLLNEYYKGRGSLGIHVRLVSDSKLWLTVRSPGKI